MKKTTYLLSLSIIAGILIGGLCFISGCNYGTQGISRADAVKLAEQRILTDGVMSLEGRSTVVKEEQGVWHISFPLTSTKVVGGEPHVFVDQESGTITKVYYTQ